MGKKRVQARQVRQQVRKVKPKGMPAPTAAAGEREQRRQRERYVESGGLLQGYAPELVQRIGLYAAGAVALCVLLGAAMLLLPYGWPVRVVAAIAWAVPIAFILSFVLPGYRLARRDRGAEPKLVQGTLLGASNVSTSFGLGMLMVRTRAGTEQYLVPSERLAKVPGNQVPVVLTVTPHLKHVKSVGLMGQRVVPRADPPVPEVVRRMRLLPIATPAALAAAVIVGDDVTAAVPVPPNDIVHALAALVVAALLGGGVYLGSMQLQRRMTQQVQALMPGMQ